MEEKNNTKKEVTLDAIAELINVSAKETTKALEAKIEASTEQLATMTQKQFLELGQKIGSVENNIKEIKADTEEIKVNMNKKVDKFTHNDLVYRVEKLEEKSGITFVKKPAIA
jgi:hypothetical protein